MGIFIRQGHELRFQMCIAIALNRQLHRSVVVQQIGQHCEEQIQSLLRSQTAHYREQRSPRVGFQPQLFLQCGFALRFTV